MNDNDPLISVIIPVYNVEAYLRECLDSVLGQTLRDIEVICVNDGSKDGSLGILRDYEANDSRLRVIDKRNEGVSVARNTGLDAARGEFILFVDADDIADRELCEKTYRKAAAEGLDLVVFDFDKLLEDGTYARGRPQRKKTFSSEMRHLEKLRFLTSLVISPYAKLSRRRLLQDNNIRFPAGIVHGEDCLFHWMVICLSRNPGYLNDVLYHYRQSPGSAARRRRMFSTSIVVYEMVENFLKGHGFYPGAITGQFFYKKMGDYVFTLRQEYPDRKELSMTVAYVKRTTSFREIPLILRSDVRWQCKIFYPLVILLAKTNLLGVYRALRTVKNFFIRVPQPGKLRSE